MWLVGVVSRCGYANDGYTVKNEVCKAHQIVSIHTLLGEKCAYRDILVCMAHFSIYSVAYWQHFSFASLTRGGYTVMEY